MLTRKSISGQREETPLLGGYAGAAAAYSLRDMTGKHPNVVRVRRSIDNAERDFTASQIADGTLTRFVNAVETKPADYGAGAAAAYSLRSVSDNYSGPVVRVRRNIDNAEQNFTSEEVSNGVLEAFVNSTDVKPADYGAGAAAAYSLRSVSDNYSGPVVRVRRSLDNRERSFTANEIENGSVEAFVNLTDVKPADYGAGAAAAYSLRYVSDKYFGPVVRVRRSSDNAERDFSPVHITNGSLLSFVGNTISDNGFVTTWYDQSRNGNHATQATAGNQPKIVDAGVLVTENGNAAVEFDGVDDRLDCPIPFNNFNASNDAFAACVFRLNNSSTSNTFIAFRSSDPEYLRFEAGGGFVTTYIYNPNLGVNNSAKIAATTNQTLSIHRRIIGDGVYVSANGVDGVPFNYSGVGSGAYGYSGWGIASTGTLYYFNGTMQEIILYPSDESGNRVGIETNINSYYGIYSQANNGFVTTWYDQSGNGNHATQTTAAAQPKIVDAGVLVTENGKAAVEFDGVDEYLISESFSQVGIFSVTSFLLGKTIIDYGYAFGGSRGGFQTTDVDLSRMDGRWASNSYTVLSATFTSSYFLTTFIHFDRLSSLYIDGVKNVDLETPLSYKGSGRLGMGSSVVSGLYQEGKLQEIVIYNSDQSANRVGIETNINSYYGIYSQSKDGFVTTWYDQSGNGNDATQATAGSQPKIVDNGALVTENGKAALDFDGVDDFFETSGISGTSRIDSYWVQSTIDNQFVYPASIVSNRTGFSADDGAAFSIFVSNYGNPDLYVNGQLETPSTRDDVHGLIADGNSKIVVHQNSSLSSWPDYLFGVYPAFAGYNFSGVFQEIILYPSDQSANRTSIESNINYYYGIFNSVNSGFVTTWYDQSGNDHHATQATAGNQPKIVDNGALVLENGKAALDFAVDVLSTSSSITNAPANTAFSVLKRAANVAYNYGFFYNFAGNRNYTYLSDPDLFIASANSYASTTVLNAQILESILFAPTSIYWRDGAQIETQSLTVATSPGPIFIGNFDSSQNYYYTGTTQELIYYLSDQSANRVGIETNINKHYDIY